VLTDRLVELPVELKKFVHRDFALACKLAAMSMSGSSRAKARDAFAVSDISKVDRDCSVPSLDLSKETASSSDLSLFSTWSRKRQC
jgi:hypothetical protein